jgi:large conductance mechanosensitive channel
MITGFWEFLSKTNALALAVAVIIGAAVGKVVSSIVGDLLMPVIGLAVGGGDWRAWRIVLRDAPDPKQVAAINIGSFLGSVVDFVIIAFCVYMITKALLPAPAPAPAAPAMKDCPACGESVLAVAKRCRYCTSPV